MQRDEIIEIDFYTMDCQKGRKIQRISTIVIHFVSCNSMLKNISKSGMGRLLFSLVLLYMKNSIQKCSLTLVSIQQNQRRKRKHENLVTNFV